MIRFFKSPQPASLFVIPVVVLILWIQAMFSHSFAAAEGGTPLFQWFERYFIILPGFIQVLIAVALVSLEAIYLNTLLNRHEAFDKNSYLPALMYALLMSLAAPFLQFHALILVNLFLLRALDKTFALFKNESPVSILFDSCFLISIASLIYFPASTLFILFLISLAILRSFNFREWIISLIGFFLPYFFMSVYFFWTDHLIAGWKNVFGYLTPAHPKATFSIDKPLLVLFIFLGVLFLLSMNRLRQNFYKNIVRTRSYQQILILFFILAGLSTFLLKTIPLYHFTILAIPLSAFFGYYFLSARRRPWLSELILWLMIGLIVWNHL